MIRRNKFIEFIGHIFVDQLVVKKNEKIKTWWREELREHQRLQLPSNPLIDQQDESFLEVETISKDLLAALTILATEHQTNLRTICFAAFCYMMKTLTFQRQFTVGIVENNRPAIEGGDKILGCFLNTVPVLVHIEQDDSWKNLIEEAKTKLAELGVK